MENASSISSHRETLKVQTSRAVAELEHAGFENRGGHGGHRNFVHKKVAKPITVSGNPGDDALHYQVRAVQKAIEESQK